MMRRDIKEEQRFSADFEAEYGRKPTQGELNLGVYGNETPAFYASNLEIYLGIAKHYLINASRAMSDDIRAIVRTAIGVALGIWLWIIIGMLL